MVTKFLIVFLLFINIFLLNGCGEPITSIEADKFIKQHIERLKEGNYTGAYVDYTEQSRNKQSLDDFISLGKKVENNMGKIMNYKKIVNPKMMISASSGRMFDINYDIIHEKGTLRATYVVEKKNGILSIVGCQMNRVK